MKELLFLLVLFVSNVIQAITGFAGTVLAMPPSVYLLGLDHAKVVLNVMAWLSGLMIAVTGYRHINWKELLKMSAVMLVGMFAGIQICRIVKSENILLTIYGIIIVVVALKNLCIHTEKKLPDLILWIVDPGRDNSWYVCIRRGFTCDLCNTGTERKRRISCDSGPCMGGAEFFSDGYPVQERPGWNGRYSTDLYQYPAITYSYMVR